MWRQRKIWRDPSGIRHRFVIEALAKRDAEKSGGWTGISQASPDLEKEPRHPHDHAAAQKAPTFGI
jgi:hypothetical protein